ncbi:MAG: hypothetical protein ABI165_17300 [Bryobacteraceae bacterium]
MRVDMLRRSICALFIVAMTALAANVKLYLKSGDYQLAREYQVLSDRVRFYSVERNEWEEIPLTLIDLPRTKAEAERKREQIKDETKQITEEDQAVRAQQSEIDRIPQDPGVYRMNGAKAVPIPAAESKIVNDKRRNILKAMSPIPIVSGKAAVELDGESSLNAVHDARPEFYIRLSAEERFGIIRLTPQKGVRIVEKLSLIPVTKQIVEQQQEIETFHQQLAYGLYKIWPEKPLEPGEYAVVEFTPATNGTINIQVWDFACRRAQP